MEELVVKRGLALEDKQFNGRETHQTIFGLVSRQRPQDGRAGGELHNGEPAETQGMDYKSIQDQPKRFVATDPEV